MSKRILANCDSFPVQPCHIDASKHLFDAFDHSETETSAGWIIRFLQERNTGWQPFTLAEIQEFYSRKFDHGFCFNCLVNTEMIPLSLARAFEGHHDPRIPAGGGWIILGNDDKYYVTEEFVTSCFKSRPMSETLISA